jgi:hypothetical protein
MPDTDDDRIAARARALAIAAGDEWCTGLWLAMDVDEDADDLFGKYMEQARREAEHDV